MAYQIDFTATYYNRGQWKKVFLRLLLIAVIGGIVWGVNDVYTTYNQPTLNMKLAEYEGVAALETDDVLAFQSFIGVLVDADDAAGGGAAAVAGYGHEVHTYRNGETFCKLAGKENTAL